MTQINDGGPAFPVPDSHHANGQVLYGSNGMSLRDWFASHASDDDIERHQRLIERSNGYTYQPSIEECKYAYADTMIAARSGFTLKDPTE
jgi:hypothetical protein